MRFEGVAPKLHSLTLTFLGDALGFGVGSAVLRHVNGSWVGTLAAAAILTATALVVDLGMRVSTEQRLL